MQKKQKFISFLESMKSHNPALVEAVKTGFKACFESENENSTVTPQELELAHKMYPAMIHINPDTAHGIPFVQSLIGLPMFVIAMSKGDASDMKDMPDAVETAYMLRNDRESLVKGLTKYYPDIAPTVMKNLDKYSEDIANITKIVERLIQS